MRVSTIPDSSTPPGDCVEPVLRSFNTWAFKRQQPSSIDDLRRCIARAMARREAIPFVLYWGKGPRRSLAAPDTQCLNYLGTMAKAITQSYAPGARLTLICTDTHALHNGHAKSSTSCYFNAIGRAAAQHGFATCRLSSLVAALPEADRCSGSVSIPPQTLEQLIFSAARWYRGHGDVETGARQYYAMNMIEREAVARAFPEAIFTTFNGSDLRELFPGSMPIFYMYALKRGHAVKPWFLNSRGESASAKQHIASFKNGPSVASAAAAA